jgi:hypothetical protein
MNEAMLRTFVSQLLVEVSMPQRFYHGSSRELKIGSTLGGRVFKSNFGDVEKVLEVFRPLEMHGRLDSVYLVGRPSDVYTAGGSDSNVYLVEPLDEVQPHHQGWLDQLYDLIAYHPDSQPTKRGPKMKPSVLKAILPEAEDMALGYWSGTKSKTRGPWEYLCGSAKVVKQVK